MAILLAILLLLFGVPWWTLLAPGASWPTTVFVAGTVLFAAAFAAMPLLMVFGHGRRHLDWAAAIGDALLGAAWVMFVWSVLGQLSGLALMLAGVEDPTRSRVVAGAVLVVVAVLLAWGYVEAMRVPRVRELDVAIARLGPGLDGLRVAVITDTHYGPIDRARWSAAVVARVNELGADIVCHVGDIADGTAELREPQASPLASVRATSCRVYVTGNHEYISEAQGWLDYMERIGWEALHNRHVIVERGGDQLVVAGVDDATARGIRCPWPPRGSRRSSRARRRRPAGPSSRAPTQAGRSCGACRCRPPDLRSHARRSDLAVQFPCPTGATGGARIEPARRPHAAVHQPRHRILGSAVSGVRAERDHVAHTAHTPLTGRVSGGSSRRVCAARRWPYP